MFLSRHTQANSLTEFECQSTVSSTNPRIYCNTTALQLHALTTSSHADGTKNRYIGYLDNWHKFIFLNKKCNVDVNLRNSEVNRGSETLLKGEKHVAWRNG